MIMDFFNPIFFYSTVRRLIYSKGIRPRTTLDVPLVSVGNLQFGGSGKTPFVMYLLQRYSKYNIAVISQSYKTALLSPERVDLSQKDFASYFGDEPSLIKKKFPNVDVWCGPTKWQTALAASEKKKHDFIILDDGFTHHKLYRDLDLLLMDGTRPIESYRLPPFGLLRENFAACRYADAVIMTKVESLNANLALSSEISKYNKNVGAAQYRVDASELKKDQRYFVFAGIGNFEQFKQNVLDLGLTVVSIKELDNHAEYSDERQEKILKKLNNSGLRGLTTAKDLIKITNPELLAKTDCLHTYIKLEPQMEQWLDERIIAAISAKNR